jgi:hypothetical protein
MMPLKSALVICLIAMLLLVPLLLHGRTGEVEELNLQEIANEGHMSLIEPL